MIKRKVKKKIKRKAPSKPAIKVRKKASKVTSTGSLFAKKAAEAGRAAVLAASVGTKKKSKPRKAKK